MKTTIALFLCIISIGNLNAQTNSWVATNGPEGGIVYSLVAKANGMIFAGTYGNGVFRSADDGQTWARVSTGLSNLYICSFLVDDAGSIYAGSEGGIHKSTDNGDTWFDVVNNWYQGAVCSMISNKQGRIVAGAYNGQLFQSTNGGSSWFDAGSLGAPVKALLVNAHGDFYAGTEGRGVYLSTNNCLSWTGMSAGMTTPTPQSMVLSQSGDLFAVTAWGSSTGIYRMRRNASTWTQVAYLPDMFGITEDARGYLYAGATDGKIWRSTDGGDSWSTVSILPMGNPINKLLFTSKGLGFAATSGAGMLKSTDVGNNWQESNRGLCAHRFFAVTLNSKGVLFAGCQKRGVFKSTDRGQSWSECNNGYAGQSSYHVAVNSKGYVFSASYTGVYRSTDEGATWTQPMSGMSQTFVFAISFMSDGTVLAGTADGIWSSTNDGDSWSLLGIRGYPARTIAYNARGDILIGSISKVFRSTNHGATWSESTSPQGAYYVNSIAVSPKGYMLAATDVGIFRSTNDGQSWSLVGSSSVAAMKISMNSVGDVFVATENYGVMYSEDDGMTWRQFNTGITHKRVEMFALDALGYCYMALCGPIMRTVQTTSGPLIQLKPMSINFTADSGRGLPPAQQVNLSNVGGGTLQWFISQKPGWLAVSPDSGTGNSALITVAMTTTDLVIGSRSDTVRIVAKDVATGVFTQNSTILLAINLTVVRPPKIILGSATLSFVADSGRAYKGSGILAITNRGGKSIQWTAQKSQVWCELSPSSGWTDGDTLRVRISNLNLRQGTYVDTIVISSPSAVNSPQRVMVMYQVVVNRSPSQARALSPTLKDTLVLSIPSERTRFSWRPATDPDVGDTVQYALWIHGASLDTLIKGLTESSVAVDVMTKLRVKETYCWCVIASDLWTSVSSDTLQFSTSACIADRRDERFLHPEAVAMLQNFPNPFNPSTTITFEVVHPCAAKLIVYNLLAQQIEVLVDDYLQPGRYAVRFNGNNLSGGTYFCVLKAEDLVLASKMLLAR